MKKDAHHVVHNPVKDGWDIKREGGDRSIRHFDRKQDAVDRAREISQNQGTELIIHNLDGKIASRDSHGNDPFPPKG